MTSPRLAMIGAGAMARYHLAAAKFAGFDLHAIAATFGSERAQLLAKEMGVSEYFKDPRALLSDDSWDAVVIAVDVPATLPLMVSAAQTGRPVLVEKPVAEYSRYLEQHAPNFPNVRVAYNRRFYRSTDSAREFLADRRPAQVLAQIPDGFAATAAEGQRGVTVRYNSVHVLDMLRFLLGDLEPVAISSPGAFDRDLGRILTLRSSSLDTCVVYANWDHPSNFSVVLDARGERFELRPLEFGYHYRGMQVDQPTDERPLRMYRPKCVKEVGLESEANCFKPGFVGQMKAFRCFTDGDEGESSLATLQDAVAALRLAEILVDGITA